MSSRSEYVNSTARYGHCNASSSNYSIEILLRFSISLVLWSLMRFHSHFHESIKLLSDTHLKTYSVIGWQAFTTSISINDTCYCKYSASVRDAYTLHYDNYMSATTSYISKALCRLDQQLHDCHPCHVRKNFADDCEIR